jgi:nucleoside 2-deoxyribosyltransferase
MLSGRVVADGAGGEAWRSDEELQVKTTGRLTVLVSSTVYGVEELLERVYVILTQYGYDVWMSHKGTMPVLPDRSNFENCLAAVETCDLFLGIITTQYGSGTPAKDQRSITHEELLKAIALDKPRWILAHDQVVFARSLLRGLGYDTAAKRATLSLKKIPVIDDLRVVDMYEAAIRNDIQIKDRKGNWVQKFVTPQDAQLFASAQFYRYQEVEEFIKTHLADRLAVRSRLDGKGRP